MTSLDADIVWQMSKNKLIELIESGNFSNLEKKIRFYAPSFINYKNNYFNSLHNTFPSISITGSSCALKCDHCNGKVLSSMVPSTSPETLFEICKKLKKNGAIGCLISGGCSTDGTVHLDNYFDVINKIKKELDLTIFIHTGVINNLTAKRLKTAGIDAALIDIIGSDETIHKVYHLDLFQKDYEQSLQAFHDSGIPFIPHVLVGLHYGKLKGELEALKMIRKYSPSAVIIIAFMPIHGTPMEKVIPTPPEDIARIVVIARLLMPNTPIVLGCMRPKGEHRKRTDTLAVKSGINGIAFPVEEAIQIAEKLNLEISFSSLCCSQIFKDILS